jgi:hypothetical protein
MSLRLIWMYRTQMTNSSVSRHLAHCPPLLSSLQLKGLPFTWFPAHVFVLLLLYDGIRIELHVTLVAFQSHRGGVYYKGSWQYRWLSTFCFLDYALLGRMGKDLTKHVLYQHMPHLCQEQ